MFSTEWSYIGQVTSGNSRLCTGQSSCHCNVHHENHFKQQPNADVLLALQWPNTDVFCHFFGKKYAQYIKVAKWALTCWCFSTLGNTVSERAGSSHVIQNQPDSWPWVAGWDIWMPMAILDDIKYAYEILHNKLWTSSCIWWFLPHAAYRSRLQLYEQVVSLLRPFPGLGVFSAQILDWCTSKSWIP